MAQAKKAVPYSDLSEDSIRCRINRHVWKPITAKRVLGAFETQEACEGCHAERYTIIGNLGDVRSRRVKYPENYLSKDGRVESQDRNAMRLMVLHWDYKI